MFQIKSGWSKNANPVMAVRELAEKVKQPDMKLVGFFVSSKYDFEAITREMHNVFPHTPTIGCTTAGEVVPGLGYTEGTITAFSVADDQFRLETLVIPEIRTKAMMARPAVTQAAAAAGIAGNNGFGILLVDGLQEAEEKVLMMLNAALPNVPIIGGSAGDDLAFKETKLACNGQTYTNAAVLALFRTDKKVFTYRENIYVPTNIELRIDEGDPTTRTVTKIDGMPATQAYARAVGCAESDVESYFKSHPVGRTFGSEVWITSPQRVMPGGAIKFYTQIMPGSTVKLLKAADAQAVARQTAEVIQKNVANCTGILAFNCILRYLQFKEEKNAQAVYDELAKVAPVVGFTTYGEQFFRQHVNQTLTLLAVGEMPD